MTVQVARRPTARRRASGRRFRLPVHPGQVVAAQAAAALLVIASAAGLPVVALAAVGAAALVGLAWIRLRGRWLYQWLGVALRYAARRRALAAPADAAALLGFVAPQLRVLSAELDGDPAAVLVDGAGLTAVLELGDPASLLGDAARPLPSPVSLLPAAAPDTPQVRLQLLVAGVPAPVSHGGAGTPATSYRQLTEGRLLSHQQALLAVRVARGEPWSEEDLRRALSGVVRKLRRRLGEAPSRPLGPTALLRVITDLAHHDGGQPARESWPAVQVGGLLQASFRMSRWPEPTAETTRRLVARLLALPSAATTVAVAAGPPAQAADRTPVSLVVRVAAGDAAGLRGSVQALHRLLADCGATAQRLDGEHLDGLAATLPLGGPEPPLLPALLPDRLAHHSDLATLEVPTGGAGLMIGTNRHGAPVLVRLFRAEPTRALVVGGLRGAQLIVLRAMAVGARIVLHTARPQAWEPFVRGASAPGAAIVLAPPGQAYPSPPGTPLAPLLTVLDIGPVGPDAAATGGWQATLVVRDDLTPVDVDALSRADLVLLPPLRPDEAALAGFTLGLGDATQWLTRIRQDMVGVVNRRSVRWALIAPTPIEQHLIGPPGRG
ncbi:MAG TPA: type VII secretion protein EccE [Pilimelia sp.]|nr:type VII secretion protein EccE [Pilimelia sp.]